MSSPWSTKSIPNYAVALAGFILVAALGGAVLFVVLLWRDSMKVSSFYRSKAINLTATVEGLKELSYTDPITGVPNSKARQTELVRSAERARRCLIMLDLKNFGHVNERHDHSFGDE